MKRSLPGASAHAAARGWAGRAGAGRRRSERGRSSPVGLRVLWAGARAAAGGGRRLPGPAPVLAADAGALHVEEERNFKERKDKGAQKVAPRLGCRVRDVRRAARAGARHGGGAEDPPRQAFGREQAAGAPLWPVVRAIAGWVLWQVLEELGRVRRPTRSSDTSCLPCRHGGGPVRARPARAEPTAPGPGALRRRKGSCLI